MAGDDGSVQHYLQWARKPRSAIWLYILAVPLMFFLWQITAGVLSIAVNNVFGADSQMASVLTPMTFAGPAVALLVLVWVLFGRPVWRVAVPGWPPRWMDYAVGLGLGWAAQALSYGVLSPWLDVQHRGWGASLEVGIAMVALLLLGLVVQTGFEEMYFRGLVMQATYRIVRWMPVVIGFQALFFAQLHIGNVAALGTGLIAATPYLVAAIGFGWVAWRTGSLLMSMGLHMANNSFIILGVGIQGDVIAGPAAWVAVPSLRGTILFSIVYWAINLTVVELIVRRRRPAVAA